MIKFLHVGIDVDGTLRDSDTQFLRYVRRTYDIELHAEDFDSYGFPNITDRTGRKVIQDVFANPEVGRYVFEEAPALANAYTGYSLLSKHPKIKTYVVSSQKRGYEQFTDRWLDKEGFNLHEKTFYENNKLRAPVQVIIDNQPKHIEKYMDNQRDGILMIRPNQEKYESERSIPQVTDMIEAYQYIIQRYSQFL